MAGGVRRTTLSPGAGGAAQGEALAEPSAAAAAAVFCLIAGGFAIARIAHRWRVGVFLVIGAASVPGKRAGDGGIAMARVAVVTAYPALGHFRDALFHPEHPMGTGQRTVRPP